MEIKKVLVVDDNESIRRISQIALEQVGKWEVTLVDSGPAALEAVQRERFDLILLDVMMPKMDGPTTFNRLRENDCHTPVIFITAKVMKQEIDAYCRLGAIGVVTKPFDPMTLPCEIRTIARSVVQFRSPETASI